MGLNITVDGKDCGCWSYSGFNEFRERLASEIGIVLSEMAGFNGVDKKIISEEGFEAYLEAVRLDSLLPKKSWEEINDPIVPLLNHSDCEGILKPDICEALANRLEEITENWDHVVLLESPEEWQKLGYPSSMTMTDYHKKQSDKLVAGLRLAAKTNKPVEFH